MSKFPQRPKSLTCYICGREYFSKSLAIHQKQCAAKFEAEEAKKPKNKRRQLPQPPKDIDITTTKGRLQFNEDAYNTWDTAMLSAWPNCGRTFRPDRLEIHLRSCHAGRILSPLPQQKAQAQHASGQTMNLGASDDARQCPTWGKTVDIRSFFLHQTMCAAKEKRKDVAKSYNIKSVSDFKDEEVPKWKRQSMEFQSQMKYTNRAASAERQGVAFKEPPPKSYEDKVKCPYCERNFAPTAAERHIPICQNVQNRPKKLVESEDFASPEIPRKRLQSQSPIRSRPITVQAEVTCPTWFRGFSRAVAYTHIPNCKGPDEEKTYQPELYESRKSFAQLKLKESRSNESLNAKKVLEKRQEPQANKVQEKRIEPQAKKSMEKRYHELEAKKVIEKRQVPDQAENHQYLKQAENPSPNRPPKAKAPRAEVAVDSSLLDILEVIRRTQPQ